MRTTTGWLAWLLTAGVALAPTGARGQEYPPADPVFPFPLYHDRPETGGFFFAPEFMFMRQTNPLKHQLIAVRGLLDFDGTITRDLTGQRIDPATPPGGPPIIIPGTPRVGNFLGSKRPALFADDAGGPESFEPGWRITGGWRFQDGTTIEVSWMSLVETKYSAVATLVPPGLNAGPLLADSFLFAPVFNFPNDFAGPGFKLALGNPLAAFGIWNGASVMSIDFVQRFSQYDVTARIPAFETDFCRCYGLVGPRYINLWERFKWRTVSLDFQGTGGQNDVAIYSNVVSNQMYGVDIGLGNEYWLGRLGNQGFSITAEVRAAGLFDFVKEIAKYERGDFFIAHKRARNDYRFVPELQAQVALWWYPFEGVQVRVGYEIMTFFDTVSSGMPVSFNYGGLDPSYQKNTFRLFDGLSAGIGFIF
jgi:hypothetical protein